MAIKQDFEVKVSKKEVVVAVLPEQEHWLPQSNLELMVPPADVCVFFCYKKPTSGATFDSMVSVLKKALAQTLVSYYALAGEMVQNLAGEPELHCNNRGVEFIEAFADIELQELDLYNTDESIKGKLVPQKKQGVLTIQATELKCGGMVVGCTIDHRVADAYSANMFLVSWAEMAQSKPLSMQPSYRRSQLSPRRPGHYDPSIDYLYMPISKFQPPEDHHNNVPISHIYYIEAEQVHQLQSLANANNPHSESKRTKFEAFSAFLWKMMAMEKNFSENQCSRLGIMVDGRTRLADADENQVNLMNRYFGNVLSSPFGDMKNEELRERPLSWIANEVHKIIEGFATREHFLGLIDYVEIHRPDPILAKLFEGKAISISTGQRFPVRKIDFGWGEPALGSFYFPQGGQMGYVMPMPSACENGDWVVYMRIARELIEVIEKNAAHVFKRFTPYYLN